MGHRFLSAAWVEEGQRVVNASPDFARAAQGASGTVLTEVTKAPDGKTLWMFHEFSNGQLVKAEAGENGAMATRSAEFRVIGSYDAFAKLQRGEATLQAAYFNGWIKLKGDMQRALKLAPALIKYHELMRRVETEF